jgi:hypothetical protein
VKAALVTDVPLNVVRCASSIRNVLAASNFAPGGFSGSEGESPKVRAQVLSCDCVHLVFFNEPMCGVRSKRTLGTLMLVPVHYGGEEWCFGILPPSRWRCTAF